MEITKLSTKGQIVIPEEIRKDIESGTAFIVSRQNDLIVLKKVEGLTKQEIKEMKELEGRHEIPFGNLPLGDPPEEPGLGHVAFPCHSEILFFVCGSILPTGEVGQIHTVSAATNPVLPVIADPPGDLVEVIHHPTEPISNLEKCVRTRFLPLVHHPVHHHRHLRSCYKKPFA